MDSSVTTWKKTIFIRSVRVESIERIVKEPLRIYTFHFLPHSFSPNRNSIFNFEMALSVYCSSYDWLTDWLTVCAFMFGAPYRSPKCNCAECISNPYFVTKKTIYFQFFVFGFHFGAFSAFLIIYSFSIHIVTPQTDPIL